jgi:hypothetical protein
MAAAASAPCQPIVRKFIEFDADKWRIVEYPITNLPVITVCGGARQGKSTLLNLIARVIRPEQSSDIFENSAGVLHVTRGIDFAFTDKYLLVDTKGIKLENSRFDHHLMLISYMISNVLVYIANEKLDNRIYSDLNDIFSFLHEIKDGRSLDSKPVLFIRIKDFIDYEEYATDPINYMAVYVDDWLKPKGDQFDKLKAAIKSNFSRIVACASDRPKFNAYVNTRSGLVPKSPNHLDIYKPDFNRSNPSFVAVAKSVVAAAASNYPHIGLLTSAPKIYEMLELVQSGEYTKLDFYSLRVKADIQEYIIKVMRDKNASLYSTEIIKEMNGTQKAAIQVESKKISYNKLKDETERRFKIVNRSILRAVMDPEYKKIEDIITEANNRNIELAETMMKEALTTYYGHLQTIIDKKDKLLADGLYEESRHMIKDDKEYDIMREIYQKIDIQVASRYGASINNMNIRHMELECDRYNSEMVANVIKSNRIDEICAKMQSDCIKYYADYWRDYDAKTEEVRNIYKAYEQKRHQGGYNDLERAIESIKKYLVIEPEIKYDCKDDRRISIVFKSLKFNNFKAEICNLATELNLHKYFKTKFEEYRRKEEVKHYHRIGMLPYVPLESNEAFIATDYYVMHIDIFWKYFDTYIKKSDGYTSLDIFVDYIHNLIDGGKKIIYINDILNNFGIYFSNSTYNGFYYLSDFIRDNNYVDNQFITHRANLASVIKDIYQNSIEAKSKLISIIPDRYDENIRNIADSGDPKYRGKTYSQAKELTDQKVKKLYESGIPKSDPKPATFTGLQNDMIKH